MSEQRDGRRILPYLYGLVITVAVTALLLLGLTFFRYQSETQARDRVEEYHLRTLSLTNELSARLAVALSVTTDNEMGDRPLPPDRELVSSVFSVGQGVEALATLQGEFSDARFERTVVRAEVRASLLREATVNAVWTADEWKEELDALDLTIFQLSRLHSIAAETQLQEIDDRNRLVRWVAIVGVPLILIISGGLIARVITAIRRRLQELDETNEALIQADLRIEQTRRMEALGTLVGGVAHDFNNLLTVILAYADVTQSRISPDDPAYMPLRNIQTAAERASSLTRQLLAFSRQDVVEPELTDLNTLVQDLKPVLQGLVRSEIELEVRYAADLPPVLVDRVQVDQVLLNLVVNARDALPDGGTILIQTDQVDITTDDDEIPMNSYCRVRVADTGHGMSPEVQDRVFEPFFTTKEAGEGTGLGLSTVHGVVAKNDGYVTLTSEVGVGTTFCVYLPEVAMPEHEPDAVDILHTAGGAETILLVEDEAQIRELCAGALRDHGYRVIEASDAYLALDAALEAEYEVGLVVTDLVMPGMRGTELVDQLREVAPQIRAIYMSGYSETEVLSRVRESGDPFIPKPFKIGELIEAVRNELDRTTSHLHP